MEKDFRAEELSPERIEKLRILRANFLRAAQEKNAKIILIASDRDARSTVRSALELAYALTADGKKVLLADLDRKNAVLASLLPSVRTAASVNDYLAKDIPADSLVAQTGFSGLDVVLSSPDDAVALSDERRTGELLKDLSSRYDYVFVLAAPRADRADIFSFDDLVDGVCIAVHRKSTRHRFLKEILSYYLRRETPVVGVFLI